MSELRTDICETCRYFESHGSYGECRRRAPVLVTESIDTGMLDNNGQRIHSHDLVTRSPSVSSTHWCGEHRDISWKRHDERNASQ
jgi:hypothetical protein